jgi:hypothetical protein
MIRHRLAFNNVLYTFGISAANNLSKEPWSSPFEAARELGRLSLEEAEGRGDYEFGSLPLLRRSESGMLLDELILVIPSIPIALGKGHTGIEHKLRAVLQTRWVLLDPKERMPDLRGHLSRIFG